MRGKFIQRSIITDVLKVINNDEVVLIFGPRQVGKTTLMKMIKTNVKKKGFPTLYLNLDFEVDMSYFKSQTAFLNRVELEFGRKTGYVFIDEIQYLKNAGRFIKGIYDKNVPYRLIVSGSADVELRSSVKESLVGRKYVFNLYPISLKEFLNFRTDYKYEGRLSQWANIEIESATVFMEEYMTYGGYPKVVTRSNKSQKIRELKEIVDSVLLRDFSNLLKVRKTHSLWNLLRYLAERVGESLILKDMAQELQLSYRTLDEYLWLSEGVYLIERVFPFSTKFSAEIKRRPVFYFTDLGWINALIGEFVLTSKDKKLLFNNLVFLVLREKFPDAEIFYWKTKSGAQIDFVVKMGRKLLPVMVQYNSDGKMTRSAVIKSFVDRYFPEQAWIVTPTVGFAGQYKKCQITGMSVFDLVEAKF